jgi:hypothetical protein
MALDLAGVFEELNAILVICPCCGDVFRLSEGRPYIVGRKPATPFDPIAAERRQVTAAEERFEAREGAIRLKAKEAGRKLARRALKKIDPVFTGRQLDTQDVKVLFDPVEYVVFDGLARGECRRVLFLAETPSTKASSTAIDSLAETLRKGNYEFGILRVGKDGGLDWSPTAEAAG